MISSSLAQQDPQKFSCTEASEAACAVVGILMLQVKSFKFILIDLLYVLVVSLLQQVLDAFEWQRSPRAHLLLPLEHCHLKLDGNAL